MPIIENFKAIELKKGFTKEKKPFYYLVVYSSLNYLFNVFIDESSYNNLKQLKDLSEFNVSANISRVYDDKNKTFRYYLDK